MQTVPIWVGGFLGGSPSLKKGSSISWVAKLKGDETAERNLSNGWSRSYTAIKLLLSAGRCVVAKLQGDKSASQSCMELCLAHQNRTIAIASDFRVDGAKSPEIPQKEGVLGSEIAARNRKSLATFHRTLKSQCGIAFSCFRNRAISGVRDGHRNRKSQKSLRFRCAKELCDPWIFWTPPRFVKFG